MTTKTSATRRRLILAALASTAVPLAARANTYPSKPIRVIVPWPAGGVSDVATRRTTARLEQAFGQSIVIENKVGASGMIGSDYVSKAAPDGYTLLRGDMVTHAVTPYLFKNTPYDPVRDFTHVSLHGRGPVVLVVNASLPVHTLDQLVTYAKANPEKVTYGAPIGAPQHLASELLRQLTGAPIMFVPYKGESHAVTDLVAGQIQMMFTFTIVVASFIKAGRLRPLTITLDKRIPALPDVPSVRELGLKELEMSAWGAFFAPPGTPKEVVDRFSAELRKVMNSQEVVDLYHNLGADPVTSTPDQLAAFVRSERERWARVVERAGIRIDQ
jgi:tripartite-type tricarboxylate transporter receptor subunit TctC